MQGKIAVIGSELFTETLNPHLFTSCSWLPRWRSLALPSDVALSVDLSKILYRAARGIGGSWTELQHSDSSLAAFAAVWAADKGLPSQRICPLCSRSAGTPRHVILSCPELTWIRSIVCDVVERELTIVCPGATLIDEAIAW